MDYKIITNCSSRKRVIGIEPLVPVLIGKESVDDFLMKWLAQIRNSQVRVAPLDLYQGRSIAECRRTARLIEADIHIISAGLGLVSTTDQVPNYSVTVSEGAGSLQKWLSAQGATPLDWWKSLTTAIGSPNPISNLVNGQSAKTRFLIALPASYMGMIANDVALVTQSRIDSVRIFTSYAGLKHVPYSLKGSVMPYDERLEGVANYGGTRSDFSHRALKHFVAHLQAQDLSVEDARTKVCLAMSASFKRIVPTRQKTADEQIEQLIRTHWNNYQGNASKLLRFLRDDANVACEQSRFSEIWRGVKGERASNKGIVHA